MALPSSGTITLLQIQTEFGGTGSLITYYRGGGNVPNTAANAGIPTSGTITLQDFYGSAAYVNVDGSRTPPSLFATRATTGVLTAGITVTATDGTGSYTYNTVWLSGGASISITGATTATPGVSSTSGTLGVTRTGTLRTTISDGTTNKTLDTPVTLEWTI